MASCVCFTIMVGGIVATTSSCTWCEDVDSRRCARPAAHYQALGFPLHGVVACSCNAGAVRLSGLRDPRIRILTEGERRGGASGAAPFFLSFFPAARMADGPCGR